MVSVVEGSYGRSVGEGGEGMVMCVVEGSYGSCVEDGVGKV